MQLTILGGAAAWPNPGQGCSSYLLTTTSTSLVVDCGSDTLLELRKHHDLRETTAVVLSHCHSDHMLDLVPFRYGLLYGPHPAEKRIPLWVPPEGEEMLTRLAFALGSGGEAPESFWSKTFEVDEYDPDVPLQIGDLNLRFAETQHFVRCFAIRVESADGRALFYSSDTGSIAVVAPLAANCDLALVEGTVERHPEGPPELRGHLTPAEAGELAAFADAGQLVVTHLWHERDDAVVIEDARRHYSGSITTAKPGMVIDV